MNIPPLALLPVSGPQFLGIYGLLLTIAIFWALARKKSAFARFEPADAREPETVWQTAQLSAGSVRVTLVAILSLVARQHITIRRFILNHHLVRVEPSRDGENDGHLDAEEAHLLRAIKAGGTRGLAFHEIHNTLAVPIAAIETRLAALGLRPTAAEKKSASFAAVMPFFLPLGLGILRLVTSISTGKPIGWLIAMLVLTGILMGVISASTGHLTATGKRTLLLLRHRHRDLRIIPNAPLPDAPEDLANLRLALALFGPAAIRNIPGYRDILKITLRNIRDPSDGSGIAFTTSGCSSGCSSGCGGGCGGCGGGD